MDSSDKNLNSAAQLDQTYTAPEIAEQRRRTLSISGLREGECVLDIGCGTGFLSLEMAGITGKSGHIVAMDPAPEMIDAARIKCRGLEQIEFKQGSINSIPEPDSRFDLVTCTQVLLYVENIENALAEIFRVLKPDGRVVIVETDWQGLILHSGLPELTRSIVNSWDATVASPNLPRRLGAMLKNAGFNAVRCEAIPLLNMELKENSFAVHSIEWLSRSAYKRGAISSDQGKSWVEDIRQRGADDDFFFCLNRFVFLANR